MNDSQTDPRSPPESDAGPEATAGADAIVPRPVHDEVTVELVRDAIDVARGELSDERFSEKYGTAGESSDERDRVLAGAAGPADGDQPGR